MTLTGMANRAPTLAAPARVRPWSPVPIPWASNRNATGLTGAALPPNGDCPGGVAHGDVAGGTRGMMSTLGAIGVAVCATAAAAAALALLGDRHLHRHAGRRRDLMGERDEGSAGRAGRR